MPNNHIQNSSRWSKLWITCVSAASYLGQSFPPLCGLIWSFAELCKSPRIFHPLVNTLSHELSTTRFSHLISVITIVFHAFHSTYYYEYESNLLIKGA